MGHENKGLLQRVDQLGDCCHERSEEDRHFHYPRCVPHQDQDQASHKSMREEHLWQGNQGEGQASKDGCESLPSCCTQEADLGEHLALFSGLVTVGIPRSWLWKCMIAVGSLENQTLYISC